MISVILLMAGSGARMNMSINKVLLPLKGKPIYENILDLFKSYNFEIILVVNELDQIKRDDVIIVNGGKTRQESVYNALKVAKGDYVLIHDAARPLLAKDVLDNILSKVSLEKAILTASPVKNTIKLIDNEKLITLNRAKLIAASTPQGACKDLLLKAHEKARKDNISFTDDISLIEKYYSDILIDIVYENEENFKVTTPLDYKLIKLIGEKND